MAAFNKFQVFTGNLCIGKVHDLNADALSVYLTNTAPNAATMNVKADLAEIATGNGYTGPQNTNNTASESGGITTVTGQDITITASGGTVGPFRYVPYFNDTPASPLDPLIGWWDYGSALTLNDGESFVVDFGASVMTFQ